MNRLITVSAFGRNAQRASMAPAENTVERLVKYIPSEIISGYVILSGLVEGAIQTSPLRTPASWLVFAFGALLTPAYLWRTGRPFGDQWWQLPISTLSFVLWAYALGGPFVTTKLFGHTYESWFAALLAGAFSWAIALVWRPVQNEQHAHF
jgi:hypothetical protein